MKVEEIKKEYPNEWILLGNPLKCVYLPKFL